MAIWQFECYIIPKKNANVDVNLELEDAIFWGKQDTSIEIIDFLEKQKSWYSKISQYGKEDETCIEFLYENEVLEEISCRFDLCSLSKKLLEQILDYAKKIDGLIFYDNEIFPPNTEEIVELMKCSKANKLCQNPIGYFAETSENELI